MVQAGFADGAVVKNSSANARKPGDVSLITGLGRSPGGGHATHSSILAWRTQWTEEPGRVPVCGVTKS